MCSTIHSLIWRITNYSLKLHFVFISCTVPISHSLNIFDETLPVGCYFFYQFITLDVHPLHLSETGKGADGDAACHIGVADHIDVVHEDVVPDDLLFLYRVGLHVLDESVRLEIVFAGAVERIGHVERIKPRLGVDLQDVGIEVVEDIARYLPTADEARLVGIYPLEELPIGGRHLTLVGPVETLVVEAVTAEAVT